MIQNRPIRALMSPNPVRISWRKTPDSARRLLVERKLTFAPVVDDRNVLVGVVSATDLTGDRDTPGFRTRRLSSVMTRKVLTLPADATLVDAARALTESGLHHLVVIDDDEHPLGVLSTFDCAVALADAKVTPLVGSVASKAVIGLDVETSIDEARAALQSAGTTALVALRDGEIVGLVSQSTLLGQRAEKAVRVGEIMEVPPMVVSDTTSLGDFARFLAAERVHRVLVRNAKGGLVGILTATDVVKTIAENADALQ